MTLIPSLLTATILPVTPDTLRTIDLDEVAVVATPKENGALRDQATSVSLVGQRQIEQHRVQSLKGVSSIVPNFFIPDYGSHLTTAAYIRGIGSRINTPAVGLYVDNVPFVDKSAFDFSLYDIERIDVLRGPQSTLYGRNAMGGLVRIYTKDPFNYEGTDLTLGMASYDNYKFSVSHSQRVSDRFAFSTGLNFQHRGGYFSNDALGLSAGGYQKPGWQRRADSGNQVAARWRGMLRPSDHVSLSFHANYEYNDEAGYPYFFTGWANDAACQKDFFRSQLEGCEGTLAYNRPSGYNRHLLNLGVNAEHRWEKLTLTNIAGFQWLSDDMQLDQDFTPIDIYTLGQQQKSRTVTDEIALKSRDDAWKHWEWSSGVSGFWQGLTTEAPVVFRKDGIAWLNGMMNGNANHFMPTVQAGPMTMAFKFSDQILDDHLAMEGRYKTPTAGAAFYHQSRLKDLLVKGLSLTLGARLDYEHLGLDYASWYDFQHNYSLSGHLTMPTQERDIAMVQPATYDVQRRVEGTLHHNYLQFLPKASLMYEFGASSSRHSGNVYATVSRGYRSGGYNIQMFSEVLQDEMTADIMRDVCDVTLPVLQSQPAVPADTKAQVSGILQQMATAPDYDISALTLYKPEYAWNYEIGTHLNLFDHRLQLDLSAFYIDTRDQQVSRMSENGFGRVTVNAGKSRSAGVEASILCQPLKALTLRANYGFTDARFKEYLTIDADNKPADYSGNYVPFVPQHTLNASGDYSWFFDGTVQRVGLGLNYTGVGRIYWTEDNGQSQSFYSLLGANVVVGLPKATVTLWGRNLTGTEYNTFYFETMHRGFEQHGRPFEFGVDVKLHF